MTLEAVFDELASAVWPLEGVLSSPDDLETFLQRLGYSSPASALGGASTALAPLRDALVAIAAERDAIASGVADGGRPVSDYLGLGDKLLKLISDARGIGDQLRAAAPAVAATLGEELFDLLLVAYLGENHPVVHALLVLGGIVEERFVPCDTGDPDGRDIDYVRIRVRWDRIAELFSDPAKLMAEVYGWGTAAFDSALLLSRARGLAEAAGLSARIDDLDPKVSARLEPSLAGSNQRAPVLRFPVYQVSDEVASAEVGVELARADGKTGPTDDGVGAMPYLLGTISASQPLSETVTLEVTGQASAQGGVALVLRPQSGFAFEAKLLDSLAVSADVKLELSRGPQPPAKTIVLLGSPDRTRLEISKVLLALGIGTSDVHVAAGALGVRVVVDASGDGLLGTLLPNGATAEVGDVVLGWHPGRGIAFESGVALRVVIPVKLDLGPLQIPQVEVRFTFDPAVRTELRVNADLTIGPLFLEADGLGVGVTVHPKQNGRFGSFDLDLGLLLPTGYAASLAAGPISGGGAIFTVDDGYRGALALRMETIGFSAFAILTTKLPGGVSGFSFLATLFCEFEIQLGFGFKLTGLGGMIGIDRTVNVEQLRSALRSGQLDGLLFPAHPIQDASQILQNLATSFPPKSGQYLFGPMAKFAWGTPTLIEGKIGVILELGGFVRVVILGQVGAALPKRESPVVVLHVDFLGVIDFAAKTIALDATLASSKILDWPISGDMALRTGWGAGSDFVMSVGGFHPQFAVPAGFPSLRRVTIAFGSDNPRLTLTAYLALTLNTAQAGAHLDLYAKGPNIWPLGQFEVTGTAYFDALIQFNPFAFDVALGLALALLCDGSVVCGIGGDLRLSGPNNYYIRGKVWAEVLGVKVKVPFDRTFGNKIPEQLATADALALLSAAVAEAKNWETLPASSAISGVGFASRPAGDTTLLVDAVGGLQFAQRVVPLGVAIDRVGTSQLANAFRTFALRAVDPSGALISTADAYGEFPPGLFFNLSDTDRLRAPATESYRSGLLFAQGGLLVFPTGAIGTLTYEYETISLVDDTKPAQLGIQRPPVALGARWLQTSLREIARPRVPGALSKPAGTPIRVGTPGFVLATDQASAHGLTPAVVNGAPPRPLTFGELRTIAGDKTLVSAALVDPALLAVRR